MHLFCTHYVVEARGIEPLSENLFTQLSPGASHHLNLPRTGAEGQAPDWGSTLVHGSVKCERAAHVHRSIDARAGAAILPRRTAALRQQLIQY